MKKSTSTQASTFGRETAVRMTRPTAETLRAHMRQDIQREQMAFGLARHANTEEGTHFLVDELLLPDGKDLAEQSGGSVCPTRQFQSTVYILAQQARKSIVEFHTHPGGCSPLFSITDQVHAAENAEYIRERLPEPSTLVMVVGNNRFDAFDGVVFDRQFGEFFELHRLEFLGRPTDLFRMVPPADLPMNSESSLFDRQRRIPRWNQEGLERQRIGIVGAGGNGAPLLELLTGIGAGRQGFIAVCDHDSVEVSNLPRIPYAGPEQLGTPKVSLAAQYVGRKSPGTPLYPFPCRFNEAPVLRRMKAATVLFYCGDNDGGRKEVNDLAVRHGIPLIDLGCDIQVTDDKVISGGQVRLVLPGETACLVCCRGFDPAQAALDQMTDAGRIHLASHGYVVGAAAEATPSVANLNGLAAQYAVSQFLALVNGAGFAQWDYLHFDQFTGRTIPARTARDVECPLCGHHAELMAGDPIEHHQAVEPTLRKWPATPARKPSRPRPHHATVSKRQKRSRGL